MREGSPAESDFYEFGWSLCSDGEPVADAVGYDDGAVVFPVEPGPVAECDRPHADALVEHELATVSVPRKSEWDGVEMIECVWVMREEDGERAGAELRDQGPG